MLNVTYYECNYAGCRKQTHYAECRYAECRYAECRSADKRSSLFGLCLATEKNVLRRRRRQASGPR
jgi:hypothetical protein